MPAAPVPEPAKKKMAKKMPDKKKPDKAKARPKPDDKS